MLRVPVKKLWCDCLSAPAVCFCCCGIELLFCKGGLVPARLLLSAREEWCTYSLQQALVVQSLYSVIHVCWQGHCKQKNFLIAPCVWSAVASYAHGLACSIRPPCNMWMVSFWIWHHLQKDSLYHIPSCTHLVLCQACWQVVVACHALGICVLCCYVAVWARMCLFCASQAGWAH